MLSSLVTPGVGLVVADREEWTALESDRAQRHGREHTRSKTLQDMDREFDQKDQTISEPFEKEEAEAKATYKAKCDDIRKRKHEALQVSDEERKKRKKLFHRADPLSKSDKKECSLEKDDRVALQLRILERLYKPENDKKWVAVDLYPGSHLWNGAKEVQTLPVQMVIHAYTDGLWNDSNSDLAWTLDWSMCRLRTTSTNENNKLVFRWFDRSKCTIDWSLIDEDDDAAAFQDQVEQELCEKTPGNMRKKDDWDGLQGTYTYNRVHLFALPSTPQVSKLA